MMGMMLKMLSTQGCYKFKAVYLLRFDKALILMIAALLRFFLKVWSFSVVTVWLGRGGRNRGKGLSTSQAGKGFGCGEEIVRFVGV